MLLSLRLYFLQTRPTEKVASQYQNHQTETISDIKYSVIDINGKEMLNYNKKNKLVIDKKPFRLNNYEENIQELMALNFIMKSEDESFNYEDIMKGEGKVYYSISEDTYNKIKSLKNIKGIYTYVYDEKDSKNAWTTGAILSNINEKDIVKESLQEELYNNLKGNQIPKMDFMLNDVAVYSKSKLSGVEENKGVKLTVDHDVEEKIREVLSDEKYASLKNVGVTLVESKTGKIKAMLQKDESQPNVNLCMEGLGYEPGSVFKVITLATALEKGKVSMNTTFECNGRLCKGKVHGKITVVEALSKSCNTVFSQIGEGVGREEVIKSSFNTGLFNRVLNLQQTGANEAEGMEPPVDASMENISIGQTLNVTPLQMVGAVNTVVNDGVYVKPYIVDEIVDINDKTVKKYETENKRQFSSTTARIVKNAMREVVRNGTGVKAKVDGIDIGGKTGTAEYRKDIDHGWFIGFFTVNNIQYTMCVMVPAQQEIAGGETSAPIFKDIVVKLSNKK